MICPSCNTENNEGAKFCKKCGNPLEKRAVSHQNMINSMNKDKKDNTKIIIAALIVIVVVLAGAFIYLQGFGSSQENSESSQSDASSSVSQADNNNTATASQASSSSNSPKTATPTSTSMKIQGGSFYTGSELSDLTYASIYVGKENAGKSVIVQIWYSRDGSTLNHGNMVPATVHSDGYLEISSADAYSYYPDYATINLYDSNSNLMDTQSVSLSPSSGTQTF
ncbi:zinc ribbon domain-containing protein [Methanobrevibacter sp.]|uniref:zinc ribbon domain-containing protein n=1 Tax=Methanobrevibacter sp. TaxID=66852 RepID=UPI0026E0764B|nr:zinc ribbon domain-containing protein [Methanobrevibacter sp.]MDO5859582.1 zinc ribbon domain-containing protein [Methanobrevibacter sp.]